MSAHRLRIVAATFGLVAGLLLVACGARSTTSGGTTRTTTPVGVTTGGTTAPPTSAVQGSSTDAAIDQQIQDLSNALNQVNGDVSSADKAAANGG